MAWMLVACSVSRHGGTWIGLFGSNPECSAARQVNLYAAAAPVVALVLISGRLVY